jgi:hypothetical protein
MRSAVHVRDARRCEIRVINLRQSRKASHLVRISQSQQFRLCFPEILIRHQHLHKANLLSIKVVICTFREEC